MNSVTIQTLRLWSGVILFLFAGIHFSNHALGLISLELMNDVQVHRTTLTRSVIGRVVLLGAFLTHITLNLHKILFRKSWRMPVLEAVQIASGLMIPVMLLPHAVGMNIPEVGYDVDVDYTFALAQLWPRGANEKAVLMLVLWTHGCIGIHYNLRLRSWFERYRMSLAVIAVLLPVLGFLGYAIAGREEVLSGRNLPPLDQDRLAYIAAWKALTKQIVWYVLGGFLCFVLIYQAWLRSRRAYKIRIDGDKDVPGMKGQTLLDVSRSNGVEHTSVCGGRARCSTCRVAVVEGDDRIEPPNKAERDLLEKFDLSGNIRLACQAIPVGDVSVVRLIPPMSKRPLRQASPDPYRWGKEETLSIMFADLRGFTAFSEDRLPFDIVFILNRFMMAIQVEIEAHGGVVDKFMGDGVMAIFGMDKEPSDGVRDAIAAAQRIHRRVEELNSQFEDVMSSKLSIGFGIHAGPVVIGRIGSKPQDGAAGQLTVIGDTVNTASRLEGLCKVCACDLVISHQALKLSGLDAASYPSEFHSVKGKLSEIEVHPICMSEKTLLEASQKRSTQ